MFALTQLFLLLFFSTILGNLANDIKHLNDSNPLFITCLDEIKENSSITICADQKANFSQTLELLITHIYPTNLLLQYFYLYDSSDMSNFTGTLDSNILESNYSFYPRSIYSYSSCFTIFHKYYEVSGFKPVTEVRAMFRIAEAYMGSCSNWHRNVYDATPTSDANKDEQFGALTLPMGKFPMPILTFSQISPTQNDGSISNFVVKNTVNGVEYFKSDSKDAIDNGAWYNVSIYAPAISFITTAISVVGKVRNGETPARVIFSNGVNIRGIIASPLYSGISDQYVLDSYLYQIMSGGRAKEFQITFTMKQFSQGDSVVITDYNKNYSINAGGILTIKTSSIAVYQNYQNNFLMEYLITKSDAIMINFSVFLLIFIGLFNLM